MSIDPNKAFGMKATNKSYTLEFKRDVVTGTTEVTAIDHETPKMSVSQRLAAAWQILTGKATLGEFVFPMRLRNSDFYHMSYVYRPEKKVEQPIIYGETNSLASADGSTEKKLKALANSPKTGTPRTNAPKKPRKPKEPITGSTQKTEL